MPYFLNVIFTAHVYFFFTYFVSASFDDYKPIMFVHFLFLVSKWIYGRHESFGDELTIQWSYVHVSFFNVRMLKFKMNVLFLLLQFTNIVTENTFLFVMSFILRPLA